MISNGEFSLGDIVFSDGDNFMQRKFTQKTKENQFFIGFVSFCVFDENHAVGLIIFGISKSVGGFEMFEPV